MSRTTALGLDQAGNPATPTVGTDVQAPAVPTRRSTSPQNPAGVPPRRLNPGQTPGRPAAHSTFPETPGADSENARPAGLLVSLEERRLLQDLKAQSSRLVQAVMEALNGTRPLPQLSRWLTPEIFLRLQLRRVLVQESQSHFGRDRLSPYVGAQVQSIHAQLVTPQALEASVVVRTRKRTRAVAIRMESQGDSWIVTALEIG